MKNHTECETVLLGRSRYCNISHCPECGIYHLHIGMISLHLKESVFNSLCDLLVNIHMQRTEWAINQRNKSMIVN